MANSLLTPTEITREALRILHQKLNFVGNVNRQYDERFARDGAKIGDTLQIRLPNEYNVRTGRVIDVQDTNEKKVDLTVSTQKGVDTAFTSTDLTLDLQDFSERILEPGMARLAAHMEADAFNMLDDIYQVVDNSGSSVTLANILNGRKKLNDALAPMDNNRHVIMDTQANVDLVDALKGLFQDSTQIAKQYREGMVGRTAGFDFFENTLIKSHTVGGQNGSYATNGADQTGSTLTVKTGTGTINEGDVFTIAGVNRVHPESKDDTGELQQFVVTADYAGGGGDISISPAIVASGARQNVTNAAGDSKSLTFVGTASTAHNRTLAFHRDAFTFASADLEMPEGVHFAAREVFDGISMRIVRQYDINNDQIPARIDVLYGYKTIRPELAAIIAAN